MRNVLEEFESRKYGKSKPTILGLREHIFTGRYAHIPKDLFKCLVHAIYMQGMSANNIAVFLFQCFVTGLVYVQSRDQFCYYRAKSSGKSSQVCKCIFYFMLIYVKLVYELYSQSYLDYLSHNTSCFPQFQRTINRTDRYKYSVHTYTHTIYLDYLTIQIELIVFF